MEFSRSWPSLLRSGGGFGLACWLVLSGTSCQSPTISPKPPPLPVMTTEAILEMTWTPEQKPNLERYFGELERYRCAIELMRGETSPECEDRL